MQISFLHSITKEGISSIFDSLGAVAEWLAHLTAKQQASHSSVATSFFWNTHTGTLAIEINRAKTDKLGIQNVE